MQTEKGLGWWHLAMAMCALACICLLVAQALYLLVPEPAWQVAMWAGVGLAVGSFGPFVAYVAQGR